MFDVWADRRIAHAAHNAKAKLMNGWEKTMGLEQSHCIRIALWTQVKIKTQRLGLLGRLSRCIVIAPWLHQLIPVIFWGGELLENISEVLLHALCQLFRIERGAFD